MLVGKHDKWTGYVPSSIETHNFGFNVSILSLEHSYCISTTYPQLPRQRSIAMIDRLNERRQQKIDKKNENNAI